MVAALLHLLTACLLTSLALLLASPINRVRAEEQDPPAAEEPVPAGDAGEKTTEGDEDAGQDEDTGSDTAANEDGSRPHLPEGVLRRRPDTEEQERVWKEAKASQDPFLYTPGPLGPAPGVPEFYNPQDFIDPQVQCGLSRYIIQEAGGQVAGYLTIVVEKAIHPEFGAVVAATLFYDDNDKPYEVTLYLNPTTMQPVRLQRKQHMLPGAAVAAVEDSAADSSEVAEGGMNILQRTAQDRVDYVFDSVRFWHSGGGVTVARSFRQYPFSFELAQLPLLVQQMQPYGQDWPFVSGLVDGLQLHNLPLVIDEPKMADVLSAEPLTHQCFELHVTAGDEEQTYWVDRSLPRRLIKFQAGERTYNLFEYSEGK